MKVTNRSAGVVGYTIPEMSIRRRYQPGETKDIQKEEIDKLIYQPGGEFLLRNYLQVSVEDVETLGLEVEREYHLDKNGVIDLMKNGSLDEFLDALDFAPEGVIEMFKDLAVSLPLGDSNKIEALKKKTGFDAMVALKNLKSTEQPVEEAKKERRSETSNGAPKRRTEAPKYKVIG